MQKRTRCTNGTRRNKKTGSCNTMKAVGRRNCPKRSRRNKKSGICEKYMMAGGTGEGTAEASPDEVCSICLGIIENDKYTTECNHNFHTKCLGAWCAIKKTDEQQLCPYCRANIAADCEKIQPIDSAGIFLYINRMFFNATFTNREKEQIRKKEEDNDRMIQRFLDAPTFNPNVQDEHGMTPLHRAIERSRLSVIEQLLQRPDIDTTIRDYNDKLALDKAIASNKTDAIALFKKYNKVPKALKGII